MTNASAANDLSMSTRTTTKTIVSTISRTLSLCCPAGGADEPNQLRHRLRRGAGVTAVVGVAALAGRSGGRFSGLVSAMPHLLLLPGKPYSVLRSRACIILAKQMRGPRAI